MTEEEKMLQIGRATEELQSAKINLAHLKQKIKIVSQIYTEAGRTLSEISKDMHSFEIKDGHFHLSYASHIKADISENLLNEQALVSLITEYENAIKEVDSLRKQLRELEITVLG